MSVRAVRHAATGEPYRDHFDHLEDAFRVLDRRLHDLVGKIRAERGGPAAAATGWGQGMFIGDEELDALLPPPSDGRTLIELRDDLSRRVAASLDAGVELPLVELGRIFNLSAWEQEVLLLCLAPDANSRYERILAYVQDDLSRRRPTADLALDLLGPGLADRARGRVALSAEAPLRRAALIVPAASRADATTAAMSVCANRKRSASQAQSASAKGSSDRVSSARQARSRRPGSGAGVSIVSQRPRLPGPTRMGCRELTKASHAKSSSAARS